MRVGNCDKAMVANQSPHRGQLTEIWENPNPKDSDNKEVKPTLLGNRALLIGLYVKVQFTSYYSHCLLRICMLRVHCRIHR